MPLDRLGMPGPNAEFGSEFIAARFLKAFAIAKGFVVLEDGEPRPGWWDRGQVVEVSKAAGVGLDDFDTSQGRPISDTMISLGYSVSVPDRLVGLRAMPFDTPFIVQTGAATAAQVRMSKGVPVIRGDWSQQMLLKYKVGGISVVTNELLRGPAQPINAVLADLARANSIELSRSFVSPDVAGSVLHDATNFGASGSTLAAKDADFASLLALVPAAYRGAAAWVLCGGTAADLSLTRGANGDLAYPDITPFGGKLLGLDVLVTEALEIDDSPVERVIGLVDPARIFWNPGGAMVTLSRETSLEMSSAPTGATDTPTAASQTIVHMFQTENTAIKSMRTAAWYPAADCAAYMTVAY